MKHPTRKQKPTKKNPKEKKKSWHEKKSGRSSWIEREAGLCACFRQKGPIWGTARQPKEKKIGAGL